jgi:hypothetical protein
VPQPLVRRPLNRPLLSPATGCGGDLIRNAVPAVCVQPGPGSYSAYFCDRSLRAQILYVNHKDDALHEFDGMPKHQAFHFAIAGASPIRPRRKSPANLDNCSIERLYPLFTERPGTSAARGIILRLVASYSKNQRLDEKFFAQFNQSADLSTSHRR